MRPVPIAAVDEGLEGVRPRGLAVPGPGEPPGPARTVRHGLPAPRPREPLARRLPAHADLPGDLGDWLAGLDALDHALAPSLGREPCVRMPGHGRAPLDAADLDNPQLRGTLPVCHVPGVNNLLALNS